jgi:hypothetical protein
MEYQNWTHFVGVLLRNYNKFYESISKFQRKSKQSIKYAIFLCLLITAPKLLIQIRQEFVLEDQR